MTLSAAVKQEARALGFDAVGISLLSIAPADSGRPIQPTNRYGRLTEWLRRGYQATMTWMGRDPERRADPRLVLPGCRAIISLGMSYYTDYRADERRGHGRIARYAWGEDYHRIIGDRLTQLESRLKALAPGCQTRTYVDTGPVMEKYWAQEAGLGWIGKHSNLVSHRHGSWLLLGEILTTAELEADEAAADLCGTCTLCIQACPTGAIVEPYVVDARRCISYLTIEHRGDGSDVPDDLRRSIGNRIFGCDDCLDVCPYNYSAEPTGTPGFQPTALTLAPSLTRLLKMDQEEFAATFRTSPIRRAKPSGFHRNVLWAQQSTDGAVSTVGPPSDSSRFE
jgi:epoxyqueuosine reductase